MDKSFLTAIARGRVVRDVVLEKDFSSEILHTQNFPRRSFNGYSRLSDTMSADIYLDDMQMSELKRLDKSAPKRKC